MPTGQFVKPRSNREWQLCGQLVDRYMKFLKNKHLKRLVGRRRPCQRAFAGFSCPDRKRKTATVLAVFSSWRPPISGSVPANLPICWLLPSQEARSSKLAGFSRSDRKSGGQLEFGAESCIEAGGHPGGGRRSMFPRSSGYRMGRATAKNCYPESYPETLWLGKVL